MTKKIYQTKHFYYLVVVFLIVAAVISSSFAFMTSNKISKNSFTFGSVKISIAENGWSPSETNESGTAYSKVSASTDVFQKNPCITNTGKSDAVAIIEVKYPVIYKDGTWYSLFKTNASSTVNASEPVTLYNTAYSISPSEVDMGGSVIHSNFYGIGGANDLKYEVQNIEQLASGIYFGYFSELYACTGANNSYSTTTHTFSSINMPYLEPEQSYTLFDSVGISPNVTQEILNLCNEKYCNIDIKGYAIQTSFECAFSSEKEVSISEALNTNSYEESRYIFLRFRQYLINNNIISSNYETF